MGLLALASAQSETPTAANKRDGGFDLIYSMSTGRLTVTVPARAVEETAGQKRAEWQSYITIVPPSVLSAWDKNHHKRDDDGSHLATQTPLPRAYSERAEIPQVEKRVPSPNTFITAPAPTR
ncbi:hypothetical protein KEM56_001746 [Ascosphaera pollenicola]|nr:hypothetical protein KEM56_001746 [Ascosphaera pollenicola]